MTKYKIPVYSVVAILGVSLLLLPLFTHNYVYLNIVMGGDTTKIFIPLMNMASDGGSLVNVIGKSPYLGLGLVMWALGIINTVLQVNPGLLFYFYSMAVFVGAGVTLFYFGKMFGGVRTGWLVLIMALLCNATIMALLTTGSTVSIINVYIILLWALMFLVKWFHQHRWYWLVLSIGLLSLFLVVHPTGAYLPFAIGLFMVCLLAWQRIKKQSLLNWRYAIAGLVALVVSVYVTWWSANDINVRGVMGSASGLFDGNYGATSQGFFTDNYLGYLWQFIRLSFISVPVIVGILAIVAWYREKQTVAFDTSTTLVLLALSCLWAVLIGVSMLRLTSIPERQTLDASTALAIMVAIVLGKLIQQKNLLWLKLDAYALMIFGSLLTLQAWVV